MSTFLKVFVLFSLAYPVIQPFHSYQSSTSQCPYEISTTNCSFCMSACLSACQTQRNPTTTSWMSPALRTVLWRRSNGGRGLTSPASSSRSWRLPSRGIATLTWAPERRLQCGPTSLRHGSGWVHILYHVFSRTFNPNYVFIIASISGWSSSNWLKVCLLVRCSIWLEWKRQNMVKHK